VAVAVTSVAVIVAVEVISSVAVSVTVGVSFWSGGLAAAVGWIKTPIATIAPTIVRATRPIDQRVRSMIEASSYVENGC
jgi:hypothetical protein